MTTSINFDDDRINVDDGGDKRDGGRGTVDDRGHRSRSARSHRHARTFHDRW
jgi:hypothetical protein